ncbi:zinc-binding dehydrogenase [Streptomyces sp. NPDC048680]|uniref:zinc-binding dehydrogenase n=1 Tax=Streptomyces sp. NPDC048680 TaxID=3155492 RepID=UPI0034435179
MLDSVDGEILRRSFDVLNPLGRTVICGAAGGELTSMPVTDLFALKSVAGFSLIAWRAADPEQARHDITEATEYAVSGRLRTAVHARLPLAEAARHTGCSRTGPSWAASCF